MPVKRTVRVELEEQRCLIEEQHVKIQRQQHQIEVQRRLTADMQAQLDAIQLTLRGASPIHSAQPPRASNGNGHLARAGRSPSASPARRGPSS